MLVGDQNVLAGYFSGKGTNNGSCNVFLGVCAGYNNTSGYRNIVVGRGSAISASDANTQTVIGTALTGKGTSTAFVGGSQGVFNEANTTAWQQTSDRRIKKNIVNNNTGLEKINQIQVRDFEYRTKVEITDFENVETAYVNKSGVQIGVIAQEIEAIFPEMVTTQSTGVKTFNPEKLTFYLINAIKELKARIEVLENK